MTKAKKSLSVISALIAVFFALLFVCSMQIPASAAVNGKTANQIVAEMGAGWNLGNTLDATGGNGLSSETSWGNPKTTKAMIDAVKAQGFNTVRVPVSWGRHMSSDLTIDSAWMARVKEIVDYCIDNDMYVILNIHHDNEISNKNPFFYPNSTHKEKSIAFVKAVWTQVSEVFKNYDQHLIFEALNEPRLIGTNDEWWFPVNSPNANVTTAIQIINEMNQQAVNVIRASGGNNADRCIMIPGYGASIDGCTTPGYKLPTDTVANRLIVSVHAYTPYNFALNASGTSMFTSSGKNEINSLFNTLKSKFINNGIPVVIGETSASNKKNSAERIKWAEYYMGMAAEAGIPCMLWDNNVEYSTGNLGENHGHLNRSTLKWTDQAFVDAVVEPFYKDTVGQVPDFRISGRATNALRVSWSKNSNADGYILEQKVNNSWKQIAKITSNSTLTYRIADLTAATKYDFRIRAYKGDEYGKYTELSAITNPSGVTGFKLAGRASTVLRLGWTKNTDADGYIIEQYKNGEWVRIAKIADNNTTYYRVTGLNPSTTYKFRMKAYKMDGKVGLHSVYTGTLTSTTNPSPVSDFRLGGRSASVIRLNWTKNTSADGYIIEQYKNGEWVRIAKITNNSTTTYRVTGLNPSTTYKFRMKAYNMVGKVGLHGGYTEVLALTTSPSNITGLKIGGKTSSVIRLEWNKNTTGDGYIVEQYINGEWVRISKLTSNATTLYRVTGLKKATTYKFRVKAYNMEGSVGLHGAYTEISGKTTG